MLFDENISFLMPNNDKDTYSSSEGFLRGNLFKNEYKTYKDYKPLNLETNSLKEAYLFKIMELNFAINDLNLYLDLNPSCERLLKELEKYIKELKEIEKEYENKFGVLEITEVKEKFNWIDNPWPWDKEDSKYV